MVSISKNWFDFNQTARIEYDKLVDSDFLNYVAFTMVFQSSSNLFNEKICLFKNIDLEMTTIKSVHHISPSALYYFNNHEKELNAQIQAVFKKIRAYLV